MNYIIVSALCGIALLIGIMSLFENELIEPKRKKWFCILAITIIFELIIDTIALSFDGNVARNIALYKVIKDLEFITAPAVPVIFSKIIARQQFWVKVKKFFIILLIVNAIVQLITLFIPLMFEITEEVIYKRTTFSVMYILILSICTIILVFCSKYAFTQNSINTNCTLLCSALFVSIGVALRVYFEKCNSDWLALTFAYFIFMIYFSNSYLKIDSTTHLLNRKAFDNKMNNVKYTTALIIIDANEFKQINDTCGHARGDWALSKFGEIILKVYGKIGFCYRIGGDEFCVILKEGVLKKISYNEKNHDTYCILERLMQVLDDEIKVIGNEHSILKQGVSQGYGIYYSLKDTPSIDKHKTIDEVFKIADARMYEDKERRKNILL